MGAIQNPIISNQREFANTINGADEATRKALKEYAAEFGYTITNLIHAVKIALEDGSVFMDGTLLCSDKPVYIKDGKVVRNNPKRLAKGVDGKSDFQYIRYVAYMNGIRMTDLYVSVAMMIQQGKAGLVNGRFCVIRRVFETERGTVLK